MGEAKRRKQLDNTWGQSKSSTAVAFINREGRVGDYLVDCAITGYRQHGRGAVMVASNTSPIYITHADIAACMTHDEEFDSTVDFILSCYNPEQEFIVINVSEYGGLTKLPLKLGEEEYMLLDAFMY